MGLHWIRAIAITEAVTKHDDTAMGRGYRYSRATRRLVPITGSRYGPVVHRAAGLCSSTTISRAAARCPCDCSKGSNEAVVTVHWTGGRHAEL